MRRLVIGGLSLAFLMLSSTTTLVASDEASAFIPNNIMVASFLTNEVFEFDPEREPVEVRSIPVSVGPGGMTFGGPFGHLFVAGILSGTVTEIDREGNIINEVEVVDQSLASPAVFGLRGFSRGPNGNLFISVCGAEFGGDVVLELDSRTLEVVREISQKPPVTLICPGGIGFGPDGILYLTGINSGNVIGLDLDQATHVFSGPSQAVAKGIRSGKAHKGRSEIEVVEAPTVRDINILQEGEDPIDSLRALAFDTDGNLYVSGFGLGRVAVIKPDESEVDHTIPVGVPTGMRIGRSTTRDLSLGPVPDSENLFVGDLSEAGVLEIDLETGEVVRTFQNNDLDLDARFVVFVPNPFQ